METFLKDVSFAARSLRKNPAFAATALLTLALDPVTFVAIVFLFAAITVLASWIPARRAAGLDPTRALREE